MKKVYVPKGETVQFNELSTEIVVVNGHLKVLGKLTAKNIQGSGTVEAQEVICGTCTLDTLTAQIVTAQKIAVKKLLVRDCRAVEILVTDFIEALTVRAKRLSMSLSAVEVCNADEIITLPKKSVGCLGCCSPHGGAACSCPVKLRQRRRNRTRKNRTNPHSPKCRLCQTPNSLSARIFWMR